MKYALAVLTHGPARTLPATLASFRENVSPAPAKVTVFSDGPSVQLEPILHDTGFPGARIVHSRDQLGFCAATSMLWTLVQDARDVDYVFWLEHDFTFTRPVDLTGPAALLEAEPGIAQVAFVRQAVNDVERTAGGLIESRPGQFVAHDEPEPWLEHRSYYTTNPSLMRIVFMRQHPLRFDDKPYCEGRYGIDLIQRGFRFAAWGNGEVWVNHTGYRDGFGIGY